MRISPSSTPWPTVAAYGESAFALDSRTRSAVSFSAITDSQKETIADQFLSQSSIAPTTLGSKRSLPTTAIKAWR